MAKRVIKKIVGRLVRRMLPKLAHSASKVKVHDKFEVYLVSSWNTRCGIAAYSGFLAEELKKIVNLRVINVAKSRVFSPYLFILGYEAAKSNKIVQVQFAYGMFPGFYQTRRWGFSDFGAFLFYLGLAFGRSLVVTTFHEVKTKKSALGRIKLVYEELLDKLICSVSDLMIVHTSESKEHLIKNYGVNSARIKIIPMGCLENPPLLNKDKAKAKLNLKGKTVITIPGFVSKNHGHDLAVSILRNLDKNVVLLIAGGARTKENVTYYEEIKEMAKKNVVNDRIVFIDDYPIPAVVWNATDIAVLPYRHATESLSLRMLIAFRVPTITSNLSFFREIKEQYDCTEFFRSEDKEDLLSKIRMLLSNQKQQKMLQEQCKKMWNKNKWSSISKKYIETYLDALSDAQP